MKKNAILLYLKNNPLRTAWMVNTILFAFILLFGCPVYHSGDELGMAQILGGGFNMPPSECLPFLYNTHFFIGIPVKYLFRHFPAVNWFSLSLLIPQYIACIILYYVLLKRQSLQKATLCYLTWFIVFETWMILYMNISTTSMVCTIAGLALIWHYYQQPAPRPIILIGSISIIITGALVRLHGLAPVFIIVAPFFLLLPGIRKKLFAVSILVTTMLLIILLYKVQNQYYTTQCTGWEQEEAYRKAKYENINYYRDTTTQLIAPYFQENAMLSELILFDTSFPDKQTLYLLASRSRTAMPVGTFFNTATWYWSIVNNRIFLYALILTMIFFFSGRKERTAAFVAILAAAGLVSYLMMFRKLPEYIIPGITGAIVYFIALTGKYTITKSLYWKAALTLLFISLWVWGLTRTYKINQHNATSFREFREMYQELKDYPDKLFINAGDADLFYYFYCFATPADYSFKNILFIDHPVTARQPALLADFGITDIRKAPLYDNVYFRGPVQPALANYFSKILQRPVKYSDTIPGYKHSVIRKLIVD